MRKTVLERKTYAEDLVRKINALHAQYSQFGLPIDEYRVTRMPFYAYGYILLAITACILIFLAVDWEFHIITTSEAAEIFTPIAVMIVIISATAIGALLIAFSLGSKAKELTFSSPDIAFLQERLYNVQDIVNQYEASVAQAQPIIEKFKRLEPVIVNDLHGDLEIVLHWNNFCVWGSLFGEEFRYDLKESGYRRLALECERALRDQETLRALESRLPKILPESANS